jgi:hypothetical protein
MLQMMLVDNLIHSGKLASWHHRCLLQGLSQSVCTHRFQFLSMEGVYDINRPAASMA